MSQNMYQQVLQRMGLLNEGEDVRIDNEAKTKIKPVGESAAAVALAGLYHKACSREGAMELASFLQARIRELEKPNIGICLAITFGEQTNEVVAALSIYCHADIKSAHHMLYEACRCSLLVLHEELAGRDIRVEDVTQYMVAQRHHILSQLPADIQLGRLLGDTTIDDKTNKMDGPVSNIVHKIGESFSESPK